MAPLRVVFVCTANIARSPYAERRMAHLLGPSADVVVGSAGLPGYRGQPMDRRMAEVLARRGGSAAGHLSRTLSSEQVADADLILTMELRHHLDTVESWPDAVSKCFGLGQFADAVGRVRPAPQRLVAGRRFPLPASLAEVAANARPNSMTWDVPDPHKRGRRAYRGCADVIDGALGLLLPALVSAVEVSS